MTRCRERGIDIFIVLSIYLSVFTDLPWTVFDVRSESTSNCLYEQIMP